MEAYLERIMGRAPPKRAVAHLRERYEAIGGPGPLKANTEAQATALEEALGEGFVVEVGLRYSEPFVADAAEALGARPEVDEVVVVALAPQYNTHSVQVYLTEARRGLKRLEDPPAARFVRSYATDPGLVTYWAEAVNVALERLPEKARSDARVIFTAHSLPKSILEEGDPYPDECQATADAVAEAAGVEDHVLAWQSGRPGWLQPDVEEELPKLAEGASGLVVAPIGFVSEHLETLYDLDIEVAEEAEALGVPMERVTCPNDHPRFVEALARTVRDASG